jgi:hypothetical protein
VTADRRSLRGSNRPRRQPAFRSPAKTLTVYCEGRVTERQYLINLAARFRATSVSVARDHGDPKYLVELAVAQKKRARRQGEAADLIWCVFDADDHERLTDALIQARDNQIPVALSNPCFELWVILHFEEQTAYLDRAAARRCVQTHIRDYDKKLPFESLVPGAEAAHTRARALEERHLGNGSKEYENPSSGMWRFVDAVGALRTAP